MLSKLRALPRLSLLGLQEVNSAIEPKIRECQPSLTKHLRCQVGLSTVSLMWDGDVFGDAAEHMCFNVASTASKGDSRPCLVCLFYVDGAPCIVANMHAGWMETQKYKDALGRGIAKNIKRNKTLYDCFNDSTTPMIFMGDFNDAKRMITKTRPLRLPARAAGGTRKAGRGRRGGTRPRTRARTIKLSHGLRKAQMNRLRSCCWHERGHKWGHFTDTGDYIMTNDNATIDTIYIPRQFDYRQRDKLMYSDHKPVIARITF